jgi:hypothetical protein
VTQSNTFDDRAGVATRSQPSVRAWEAKDLATEKDETEWFYTLPRTMDILVPFSPKFEK